MTSFLAGPLAAAIAKGFNGKLLAGTLRKVTSTARDANGDPIETTDDYPVQGFPDDWGAVMRLAAGIPATDSLVVLIAGLCPVEPSIGDRVYLSGVWWQVRAVKPDPAKATFELQSYRVPA